MNTNLTQFSTEDIKALQKFMAIWPVKISRDIEGNKLPPLFPVGKSLTAKWKWILSAPLMNEETIFKYLNNGFELAAILPAHMAVIDVDDISAFECISKLFEDHEFLISEKSLSFTTENQKHHYWFKTENPAPYCTKFSAIGLVGSGELLGRGHLVFINKSGWKISPHKILDFPQLPDFETVDSRQNNTSHEKSGKFLEKGIRNDSLTKIAGYLRRYNVDQNGILKCLLVLNDDCDEPLPNSELKAISKSISKYKPLETLISDLHEQTKRSI